jgi:hypothetical protein
MMMDIVSTTCEGYEIHMRKIEIMQLNKMAKIEYHLKTPTDMQLKTLIIEGAEYQAWNNDDRYIVDYICSKHNLVRKPFVQPATITELYYIKNDDGTLTEKAHEIPNHNYDANAKEEVYYQFPNAPTYSVPLQPTVNISSNQSVHNDNDVAKINDLETQLATLQGKMANMLQIMISKGLV